MAMNKIERLVSAANSTSRKNKKPMKVAMPPMSTNTVGSVTNMSEGTSISRSRRGCIIK